MGYLSAPETDLLHLPSNPAEEPEKYWVLMLKKARYGDNRAAQSAMIRLSPGGPQSNGNGNAPQMITDMEVGEYLGTLTVRLIVDWNVTDENDNVLPITKDNLDLLDPTDGDFLATEAQKRLGGRTPEQQGPFPKPSGPPSTGTKSRATK